MIREERLFRYENKYLLTIAQSGLLECRMEGICLRDTFAGDGGAYRIRSLYFDDYEGSSYRDNETGVDPRFKYRLRIYNGKSDVIFLERKIKKQGKIYKERVQVSREFSNQLIQDEWEKLEYPVPNAVINRFLTAYHTRRMRPGIIVEYDRQAYVCPEYDIRITFDKNISFSDETEHFLDGNLFLQPVMDVGKELLEVKYREFMPDFLYQGIHLRQLRQCTFSKYYICETMRRNRRERNVI